MAVAAHACRDSLLRAEALIQLGLLPKPHSHTQRVPHVRQVYNWCAALECSVNLMARPSSEKNKPMIIMWLVCPNLEGNSKANQSMHDFDRDCGLACVLMVLRAAGIHSEDFSSLRTLCSVTRSALPHAQHFHCRFALHFTVCTGLIPVASSENRLSTSLVLTCFAVCSIWTVDLAYLLRRFGLDVEFTTITIGANPDYAKESFYREHMAEDGSRVERLFQVLTAPYASSPSWHP